MEYDEGELEKYLEMILTENLEQVHYGIIAVRKINSVFKHSIFN